MTTPSDRSNRSNRPLYRSRRRLSLIGVFLGAALLAAAAHGAALLGFGSPAFHLPFWIGLTVFGASAALGGRRLAAELTGRAAAHGAAAGLSGVLAVGIAVVVNGFAAARLDLQWDLTEDKLYTLSDQTKAVLGSLDLEAEEARAVGFFSSDPSAPRYRDRVYTKHLLTLYRRESGGKLQFELIDPYLSPQQAESYGVRHESAVIFEMDGRRETLTSLSEVDFTGALLKLSRGESPILYFLTGHGERSLTDPTEAGYYTAAEGLRTQNYRAEPLDLRRAPVRVPSDAAALIIAGPKEPFLAAEIAALNAYADRGGRIMVLADPAPGDSLKTFLEWLRNRVGVSFEEGAAADRLYNNLNDPFSPFAQLSPHQITETLHRSIGSVPFRFARPLSAEEGAEYAELARTGSDLPYSWLERDLETYPPAYERERGDMPGPALLGAAVEGADSARYVLIGDSDFASSRLYSFGGDLLRNAVNWLTRQEELIAIPPRDPSRRVLRPTASRGERFAFVLLNVFLAPALFSAAGVAVWLWRR